MPARKQSSDLLDKAKKLNAANKYQEVIDLLTDDLVAAQKSPELNYEKCVAVNNLGNAYYNQNEMDKAMAEYNRAIGLDPTYSYAYYNRALVWDSKKEWDKAIEDYNKTLELKPDYVFAYNNRGLKWYNKNELDKATADFDRAIELKPDYANAWYNRGLIWDSRKEWDKAIEDYNKAIELNPAYAYAYNNRGLAYYYKNDVERALIDFEKAIELKPDYAYAYNNRGLVWDSKKQWDKAIQDYTKSVELKPDFAYAYNNRGLVLEYKADYPKAEQDYTKAIELDGNYANAYRNRGLLRDLQGDYANALADFEKAIALSSEFNFLQDNVNELKLKLGQRPTVTKEGGDDAVSFIADILDFITDSVKKEKIKDKAVQFISAIYKIKKYAIITDPCPVAHYTKLWVADKLVVPSAETKLRYSNVSNMNDPEEGKIFKDILLANNANAELNKYFEESGLFAKGDTTDKNIYLGSFLPASYNEELRKDTYEDELVMWRTYGKDEHKNEAAGCSIVINSDFFYWPPVDSKPANLQAVKNNTANRTEKDTDGQGQVLYRVLYFNRITGLIESKDTLDNMKLQDALGELRFALNNLLMERTATGEKLNTDSIIYRGLSELRYFFKSSNYSFENEYRVIQYYNPDNPGVLFDADGKDIPRVLYVESTKPIRPFINRIYLGPKVPHPERWMYLELALKRKAPGTTAKVIASSVKFQ